MEDLTCQSNLEDGTQFEDHQSPFLESLCFWFVRSLDWWHVCSSCTRETVVIVPVCVCAFLWTTQWNMEKLHLQGSRLSYTGSSGRHGAVREQHLSPKMLTFCHSPIYSFWGSEAGCTMASVRPFWGHHVGPKTCTNIVQWWVPISYYKWSYNPYKMALYIGKWGFLTPISGAHDPTCYWIHMGIS